MNAILDHSPRERLLTGVRALAAGLALVVIGYGIARPPESLLSTNEARASDKPRMAATVDTSEASAARAVPASTPRYQAAESNSPSEPTEAPRECAPEQGVTQACVFN